MANDEKRKRALTGGRDFDDLNRVVSVLTGESADHFVFPGGYTRKSAVAVYADGRRLVVTRRRSESRAELEAGVLSALKAGGAPVPAVIKREGRWIVQEYLAGPRLSEALDRTDAAGGRRLIAAAVESLHFVQEAARQTGLEDKVVVIGNKPEWLETLAHMPERIGEHLDLPAPTRDIGAVTALLRVDTPRFVKWDARPGNAAVQEDGSIAWFDWEHAGRRNRLDDLGWLLGDEWSPDDPVLEEEIFARHLGNFGNGDPRADRDYLATFGTLHMCVRLSLILSRKKGEEWWDRQKSLQGDQIGVTLQEAGKLTRRAARWAAASPLLASLPAWFERINRQLPEL
jgi:hypothetical protein